MNYFFFSSNVLSFKNIPKPNMEGTQRPIKIAVRSFALMNHITIEKIIDKRAKAIIIISNWVNFIKDNYKVKKRDPVFYFSLSGPIFNYE